MFFLKKCVSNDVSKWKHKKCRISGSTFDSKKVLVKSTSKNKYIN